MRAELFRPPLPRTFVDALLDDGWDVWLLNWRASIDLDPVPWTLDEAAAYDHPAAVRHVLAATGADTLKAVVHCQGSTSFTMSAMAGLLPEVDTVVSNAVSLHPVVPRFSTFKIGRISPVVGKVLPHVSPAWGDKPDGLLSRALVLFVQATHRECDNAVCRMVSFTYGTGWPALWSHANLDEATHDWIRGEFAEVPFTFFAQMDRSIRAGHLVPVRPLDGLPAVVRRPGTRRPTRGSCSSPARTTAASCRRASSGRSSSSPGTGPAATPCTGSAATATWTCSSAATPRRTRTPSSSRSWRDDHRPVRRPAAVGARADVRRPVRGPATAAPAGRSPRPWSTGSRSRCR